MVGITLGSPCVAEQLEPTPTSMLLRFCMTHAHLWYIHSQTDSWPSTPLVQVLTGNKLRASSLSREYNGTFRTYVSFTRWLIKPVYHMCIRDMSRCYLLMLMSNLILHALRINYRTGCAATVLSRSILWVWILWIQIRIRVNTPGTRVHPVRPLTSHCAAMHLNCSIIDCNCMSHGAPCSGLLKSWTWQQKSFSQPFATSFSPQLFSFYCKCVSVHLWSKSISPNANSYMQFLAARSLWTKFCDAKYSIPFAICKHIDSRHFWLSSICTKGWQNVFRTLHQKQVIVRAHSRGL